MIPLILKGIRHLDCTDDLGLISLLKFTFPICLIICLPFLAGVALIFVDDNALLGGDGSSWGNAHKYLQVALSAASSGDEIRVAEKTYKPVQGRGKTPGDLTASFNLVSGVEMYSGFLGTDLTIYI